MQRLNYKQLSESKLEVEVSHYTWDKPKKMTLAELHALGKDKTTVESFAPGPLLDFAKDLTPAQQEEWKTSRDKKNVGCTVQLTECGKSLNDRDTVIFFYNTQPAAIQLQILKKQDFRFQHMYMINATPLIAEFQLETFSLKDKKDEVYLADRRLIVAKKNGEVAEFSDLRDANLGNNVTNAGMLKIFEKAGITAKPTFSAPPGLGARA